MIRAGGRGGLDERMNELREKQVNGSRRVNE